MGLLSKLFGGDKAAEKAAKDLLNGIFGNSANSSQTPQAPSQPAEPQAAPAQSYSSYPDSPSGFSWGEVMPAEENQYNSGKPYTEYFEGIFREVLPAYRFERSRVDKRTIYRFTDGMSAKLVIELMSQSSSAKKLRADCAKQGIPYLRFYYDHDGWWNTKAYVADRIRKVI
ncbi:MAG: hypothetical protein IJU57_01215 [Clostridia bacterium]|nr:hypothetical protein [Clostridia bacterium]